MINRVFFALLLALRIQNCTRHSQTERRNTELIEHNRNLRTCAHTSTLKNWVQKRELAHKNKKERVKEKELESVDPKVHLLIHSANGQRKKIYTINLLCYVENPYNASYWPYFNSLIRLLFLFVLNVCVCVCVWLYFFHGICSLYSTILVRINAIEWVSKWALVYGRHIDSRTSHTHTCII